MNIYYNRYMMKEINNYCHIKEYNAVKQPAALLLPNKKYNLP